LTELETHIKAIRNFAAERDWEQFHTPKNLSMALAAEAGELLAEFQWLTAEESMNLSDESKEAVSLEMADIAIYLLRLSDVLSIDLSDFISKKISINENRFPKI
jgi:dCTP diphosphatase